MPLVPVTDDPNTWPDVQLANMQAALDEALDTSKEDPVVQPDPTLEERYKEAEQRWKDHAALVGVHCRCTACWMATALGFEGARNDP